MHELTPEEKQKIYLEEKARLEAQDHLKQEQAEHLLVEKRKFAEERFKKESRNFFGCIGLLLLLLLSPFIVTFLIIFWPVTLSIVLSFLLVKVNVFSKPVGIVSFVIFTILFSAIHVTIDVTAKHQQELREKQEVADKKKEEEKKRADEAKITPVMRLTSANSYLSKIDTRSKDFSTQYELISKALYDLSKIPLADRLAQKAKRLKIKANNLKQIIAKKEQAHQEWKRKQELKASAQLELRSHNWYENYGYATFEGQVKNISSESLENVEAVVSFYDNKGNFIASSSALIKYNPILPGQSSPFKVMRSWNPAMSTAAVEFKKFFGGQIATYQD